MFSYRGKMQREQKRSFMLARRSRWLPSISFLLRCKQCVVGVIGVCSAATTTAAAAELLPPFPLFLPNPLSSPAADKEQCVAAFTLRSSGR